MPQKSWNRGRRISIPILRKCFFAYVFPHFAWIFAFYPFLLKTQREAIDRRFRVAIRTVHRCPFVSAKGLFMVTQEEPLEFYAKWYIEKRLEDIFYWDQFKNNKKDSPGHFFRQTRVTKLIKRHEILLIKWIQFVHQWVPSPLIFNTLWLMFLWCNPYKDKLHS